MELLFSALKNVVSRWKKDATPNITPSITKSANQNEVDSKINEESESESEAEVRRWLKKHEKRRVISNCNLYHRGQYSPRFSELNDPIWVSLEESVPSLKYGESWLKEATETKFSLKRKLELYDTGDRSIVEAKPKSIILHKAWNKLLSEVLVKLDYDGIIAHDGKDSEILIANPQKFLEPDFNGERYLNLVTNVEKLLGSAARLCAVSTPGEITFHGSGDCKSQNDLQVKGLFCKSSTDIEDMLLKKALLTSSIDFSFRVYSAYILKVQPDDFLAIFEESGLSDGNDIVAIVFQAMRNKKMKNKGFLLGDSGVAFIMEPSENIVINSFKAKS